MESLTGHLAPLAPIRVTSTLSIKEGDAPECVNRTEAEIDAAGNQHIWLYDGDTLSGEFLFVDKQVYMSAGEQYVALGTADDPWSVMMVYGGGFLFLLLFNDLHQAELVGREQVNGFSANKYRVQVDLSQFGLAGMTMGAQGAVLDYEGFAWVEMNAKALVKAETLYRAKSTTDEKITEIRMAFDAVKADIAPIEKPTNVLGQ